MIQTIEWPHSDNVLIVGKVEVTNDSFSHEFGTKKEKLIEIIDFHINVLIEGNYYDLTRGFPARDYMKFREKFLEYAEKSILEEVA